MVELNEGRLLLDSVHSALIDSEHCSPESYRPKLVSNDGNGKIVLSTLEKELKNCDSFDISVAFVTRGGLCCVIQDILELSKRNVHGRLITTSFLSFNKPDDLRFLLRLKNVSCRIFDGDLHTKGYIFRKDGLTTALVGSSNLTQNALKTNKEWNIRISSLQNGALVKEIDAEFESLWEKSVPITDEWITTYEQEYSKQQALKRSSPSWNRPIIKPYAMQQNALDAIQNLRLNGKRKALLISATGTGKTYISAFDVRNYKPRTMLFLVHREKILDDAMESYKNVLGDRTTYGKFMGSTKEKGEYLFSSVQTMARNLDRFEPDAFEYIVCDEVHHVVSKQYLSIINHFKPKFILGMTATPERMDGADIFELFDHNIAYEIRLQHALDNELISPFHYFGISDIMVDGVAIDDKTSFNRLTSDERIDHIVNTIGLYPISGVKRKCLVFCSTNEESKELCRGFNRRGLCSVSLSGDDSEMERVKAIDRLEDMDDSLNFIFTRDIFNEGVDIPTVNEIVMLRPTKSVVVFIQQLGRGLRKVEDKDFVTILDFIGNYENNYMIPLALFGDRSCNKDNVRRNMIVGNNQIPGVSTISFDEITKERIFNSINSARLSTGKILKTEYLDVKYKLGHPPSLCDLYNMDGVDPRSIIDYSGNLNSFRSKADVEAHVILTDQQDGYLSFISKYVLDCKRPIESEMISRLIESGSFDLEELQEHIEKTYGITFPGDSYQSAIRLLSGEFLVEKESTKYHGARLLEFKENTISITDDFESTISDSVFRGLMTDVIDCGKMIFESEYRKDFDGYLTLNKKYSRKEVCLLLNMGRDISSTVYGYPRNPYNGFCPIFVTYSKSEDISASINYSDEFIDHSTFSWMTRNNLTTDSKEVKNIIFSDDIGIKVPLFVKKEDGEGTDFYYLGLMHPIKGSEKNGTIKTDDGRDVPIVNIKFKMDKPVREDIYDYIVS